MDKFNLREYLKHNPLLKEDDSSIKFINKFNPPQSVIKLYMNNPSSKKPLSSYSRYKKNRILDALATHLSTSQAKYDLKLSNEDKMKSSNIDMIEIWADDYWKDSDFFTYGMYVDKDYFDFFILNKDHYPIDDREELPNWMDKY